MHETPTIDAQPQKVVEVESVVIRFAGDSGDGMQLTGTSSPIRLPSSATTSPPFPTILPRSALLPAP
jgi:hypothetical protein